MKVLLIVYITLSLVCFGAATITELGKKQYTAALFGLVIAACGAVLLGAAIMGAL